MMSSAARAGMKPREFLDLTPREFYCYMDGWKTGEIDKWRHTRELMAASYNSNPYLKKMLRGKDVIPLEDDIADVVRKVDHDFIESKMHKYMEQDTRGKKVEVVSEKINNIPK